MSAREALKREIKIGRIARPDKCELCGRECKPEGHHYKGYERENWLVVQFVCKVCHCRVEWRSESKSLIKETASAAAVTQLLTIGGQMSNVCFGLSQRQSEAIGERNAIVMRQLRREWEAAVSVVGEQRRRARNQQINSPSGQE